MGRGISGRDWVEAIVLVVIIAAGMVALLVYGNILGTLLSVLP